MEQPQEKSRLHDEGRIPRGIPQDMRTPTERPGCKNMESKRISEQADPEQNVHAKCWPIMAGNQTSEDQLQLPITFHSFNFQLLELADG